MEGNEDSSLCVHNKQVLRKNIHTRNMTWQGAGGLTNHYVPNY